MEDKNDLFIKKQLQKDQLISKKAEDVFNKFLEEDLKMEQNQQNFQQEHEQNNQSKNEGKGKLALKKAFAGIASLAVLLGGANVYATSQGYDNVFFMIKYLATGESQVITDKEEILSDRDITISYDKIALTDNIAVIVKSLQVKENKATLLLKVIADEEEEGCNLNYSFTNGDGDNGVATVSNENRIYTHDEKITLPDFKDDDNIIKLEIYKNKDGNNEKLAKLTINLDERLVEVEGQEEELKKISEIDLKKFLAEEQNKKDIEDGTISKTDKLETVIYDVANLSYCSGIYTATYTYSNVPSDYFETTQNVDELTIYKNTVVFELDEKDEFKLISIDTAVVSHEGDEISKDETEISSISEIDEFDIYDLEIDEYDKKNDETRIKFTIYNNSETTISQKEINVTIYKNSTKLGEIPSYIEEIKSFGMYQITVYLKGDLTSLNKIIISEKNDNDNYIEQENYSAYYKMNISKNIEAAGEIVTYYNDTYLDSITGEEKTIQMMFGNQYGTGSGVFYVPNAKELVLNVSKVNDEYEFIGWYVDGKKTAEAKDISFSATKDLTIEARLEKTSTSVGQLIKELTPSGWAGSSNYRVRLYSNGEVYVYEYDGAGEEEENITKKTLVARNVTGMVEYYVHDCAVGVYGNKIELVDSKAFNWICYSSATLNEKTLFGNDEEETVDVVGKWTPASATENGKEISLSEVFGTSIKYGGYLEINEDNTYSRFIGAYSSENEDSLQGTYKISSNNIIIFTNKNKKQESATIEDGKIKYNYGNGIIVTFTK